MYLFSDSPIPLQEILTHYAIHTQRNNWSTFTIDPSIHVLSGHMLSILDIYLLEMQISLKMKVSEEHVQNVSNSVKSKDKLH